MQKINQKPKLVGLLLTVLGVAYFNISADQQHSQFFSLSNTNAPATQVLSDEQSRKR